MPVTQIIEETAFMKVMLPPSMANRKKEVIH
jgi:hypothetical protein